MRKLYLVESVMPIAFGLYEQRITWARRNRDVPVINYHEAIENYDPKFSNQNAILDSFLTKEEAIVILECLMAIPIDIIGMSSMFEIDFPLRYPTERSGEMVDSHIKVSEVIEFEAITADFFPFEVDCNVWITQDFSVLEQQ